MSALLPVELQIQPALKGKQINLSPSCDGLGGHSRGAISLATDPSGTLLVSGDGRGTVRVWDLKNGHPLAEHRAVEGPVWSVAVCRTRAEIAFFGGDGAIRTWALSQRNLVADSCEAQSRRVLSMRYSPDDKALIWIGVEGKVFRKPLGQPGETEQLFARSTHIKAAQFDAAGRRFAVADYLRNIELIDGDQLSRLQGHRREVCSIDIHTERSLVATGSRDCTVRTWDLELGRQMSVLRGHQATIVSLAFSPDGSMIASGDTEGSIFLWCTSEQRLLEKYIMSSRSSADTIVFGQNGRLLAAGGTGSIVQVWNLSEVPRALSNEDRIRS